MGRVVTLRPLTVADLPVAEAISDDAFLDLDESRRCPADPPAKRRGEAGSARWIERTAMMLTSDPAGCWAAEIDGEVVGFATSARREDLWLLATFAVRPGLQGQGVGARLLAAAEGHGADCSRAMLSASVDHRALRRYHRAGFTFHPQMRLRGVPDLREAPAPSAGLRDGTPDDATWMDDLDRSLRGAPHGSDHAVLARHGRLRVAGDDAGYCYAADGSPTLLAARDVPTARTLLADALAAAPSGGEVEVIHITSANTWAVDVGLALGLALDTYGYLALRAMEPPAPYLHHGTAL